MPACRREFIFKLGAVIGKQPSWECVCLHKPWGLDESGPQLAQIELGQAQPAFLSVLACAQGALAAGLRMDKFKLLPG